MGGIFNRDAALGIAQTPRASRIHADVIRDDGIRHPAPNGNAVPIELVEHQAAHGAVVALNRQAVAGNAASI